jgi:hypothetical protein
MTESGGGRPSSRRNYMAIEYKFMDAGKKMESPDATLPAKSYPRFCVDLDQFPGLEADVDESVELHLKGRVCSVTHNDWNHSMEVEVTSVAVPSHTHDSVGPMNEADAALGKLRGSSRY